MINELGNDKIYIKIPQLSYQCNINIATSYLIFYLADIFINFTGNLSFENIRKNRSIDEIVKIIDIYFI